MSLALRYAARSDVGLVRSTNQDSAYAGPHLLVVADGMGGHAGGDVASSVAVARLAPLDEEAHRPDDAVAAFEAVVADAHDELRAMARAEPELAGMGTTVTALLRSGSKVALAHIGDSRAYLLRDGELSQVTVDHTFVQHLVNTGKITPEEAEHHPQRSVVMRVLGDFDMDIVLDLSIREARAGDRWLLCSDGLSGVVSHDTLAQTMLEVRDLDECADRLLELALRGGAPDNVTVVLGDLVEVDDLPDGAAPPTGPHVVGAAAKDRRAPSRGGQGAAARAAQHTAAARADAMPPVDDDVEEDLEPRRRLRRVLTALAVVVVLALLAAGAWAGYRWTQDQYFVGVADGHVAVFRGIPQDVAGIELSELVETTGTAVEDLPGYVQDRLEQTIPADSLEDARQRAAGLAEEAAP